jgi:2-C-methyl-D-erythritol 4-phosphate cytidylyltransferase
MLRHAVDAFLASEQIAHTYVVVSADDPLIDSVLADAGPGVTVLRCGGATRMESVRQGLAALGSTLGAQDWVLVHDAARPGLNGALIDKLITATGSHPVGALLALPVVDTVKRSAGGVVDTVPRTGLWLAQTPQMFRFALLREALDAAPDPQAITDDASAIEALGLTPLLVEGHPRNMKVTLPQDARIVEIYLAST